MSSLFLGNDPRNYFSIVALIFAEFLFMSQRPKKEHFVLKTICYFVVLCSVVMGLSAILGSVTTPEMLENNSLVYVCCSASIYLSVVICSVAGNFLLFDCDKKTVMYTSILTLATDSIGKFTYSLVIDVIILAYPTFKSDYYLIYQSGRMVALLAAYIIVFIFYIRKLKFSKSKSISPWSVLICVIASLVQIICSITRKDISGNLIVFVFDSIVLMASFLLFIFMAQTLNRNVVEEEYAEYKSIWKTQEEQLKAFKESIEAINVKYHDLKHALSYIEGDSEAKKNVASDIEETLKNYSTNIITGNAMLDMVLTETNFRCLSNGIRFSCMADGACISFLTESEVIALFGNMLDNSIEAVKKLDDENRSIKLYVSSIGNNVSVRLENKYVGDIVLKNGLPITTKTKNKSEHGFGMKSIKLIADKHRATISIDTSSNIFRLNILFVDVKDSAD